MSDHVKFYDYYIVEGPEVKALIESFEPISQKRSELITEAITLVEAVGWVDSQSFGDKGDKLQSFVWKADHNFPCEITIKRRSYMDRVPVIVARGKGNTSDGRAFNKKLDEIIKNVNDKLRPFPCWSSYIINHFGIMHSAHGGPAANRPFATAILTTYGGTIPGRQDALAFAIP
ncbi:TPA: Eac protein, partial [Klebsiella pneumoniae]|nr:Eac protein [Klebsiella pneumoniae]